MINFDRLNLSLADVKDVLVSDIVADGDVFVRTVQFYTEGEDIANRRPVIEVRITGAEEIDIKFTTPKLEF